MGERSGTPIGRQGHPLCDGQSPCGMGERGPAFLEIHRLIGKIARFDRARIPERVGTPAAHGCR
ncbi:MULTISPECIES: catalase [Azotobacter]|uniref:catalase n=1 Tax=Azotobacter TaxID=352 RepID=UPI000038895B|nr:catalase [Azotobacter vinelandii]GLK60562.1 hypothetical protein GCM10017624_27240 [Azotobacter vinelandii]SFW99257.1 Catalase [Azotobacter vinelandii]